MLFKFSACINLLILLIIIIIIILLIIIIIITITILVLEKLRERNVKNLVHDPTARKWQSWDLNAGSVALCPALDCLELLQK